MRNSSIPIALMFQKILTKFGSVMTANLSRTLHVLKLTSNIKMGNFFKEISLLMKEFKVFYLLNLLIELCKNL